MTGHFDLLLQIVTPDNPTPRTVPEVNIGIALADAGRAIVQANRAFCDLLGYSRSELIGMKVDDITHPDDHKKTENAFASLQSGDPPAHAYQKRYRCRDGSTLWSITTLNRLPGSAETGQPVFLGLIDDITPQMESRERLRETNQLYQGLVENLGVGLSLIGRDHRIRMVNSALAGMFGRTPEEFVGKHCYGEFEGKTTVCHDCPGKKAMKTGRPDMIETQVRRPDGSRFKARVKAFPIFEQDGTPGGFVEIVEDLSSLHATELALQESEGRFKSLAETASIGIFEVDAEGRNIYSNPAWTHMTGLTAAESVGSGWARAIPAEDRQAAKNGWEQARSRVIPWQKEHRLLHRNGDERWVQATATPVRDKNGNLLRWVGTIVDLTPQKKAMQQLAQSEERFRSIYEVSGVGMNIINLEGRFIDANPAFCAFVGYSLADLRSMTIKDLTHPEDLALTARMFDRLQGEPGRYSYRKRFVHKSGKTVWGEVSAVLVPGGPAQAGFGIGIIQDITVKMEAEQRLEYLAYHDELTGLPNKKLLKDRLGHALDKARRFKDRVAVILVGLDRFSKIADTLDQESANLVLCEITERIRSMVRKSDTLARIGDTELVVTLENARDHKTSGMVAGEMLRRVAEPVQVNSQTLHLTASLGISLYPDQGDKAETLLRTASAAMHRAKLQGGNTIEYFVPEWNERAKELLALEADLRESLASREFVLFYQPQIELNSRKVVGFEALMRWRHPRQGLVSPAEFIPLAEETGMIVPMGEWGLREACRQNMEWHRTGLPLVRMAVNISPRQFQRVDIPDLVRRVLTDTGHPPDCLELEITESMIMEDVDRAIEIMQVLAAMGVHLAIDDFGTGYSSLHYLKRFPVRRLKVDRAFVRDVTTDPNDAAIASAVVALARTMQLEVVAEGIETEAQLEFFLDKGCDFCQGFLFGKPAEAAAAAEILADPARSGREKS